MTQTEECRRLFLRFRKTWANLREKFAAKNRDFSELEEITDMAELLNP